MKRKRRKYVDKRSSQLGEGDLYDEWRKAVYKKCGNRCVACGKYSRWCNAHHIDGWDWFVAGRYDVSNGVTLCSGKTGCHEHFHKLYGKGKNDKFQFDQYLREHHGKELKDVQR